MDRQLLDILVCPKCKGSVVETDGGKTLQCESCGIKYPVRDGIPVMSPEEAAGAMSSLEASELASGKLPRLNFRVIDGPDTNMTFQLDGGTCRAIGRATVDPNKTQVFNVDIALELDESTKRLIQQYVSQQFRKERGDEVETGDGIGSFRRVPDVVLTDSSLSRLHAMLFYDEMGVGILDLVSKNGTYVNGKEIESKLLEKGDVVEMGETTISFES